MGGHQFRKLLIWQKSQEYITAIYKLTFSFPKEEQFGLTDQIRRAAVSISLNIAEGSGNTSKQEFIRFLIISKRSAYEVIAALEIARNLGYSKDLETEQLINKGDEICSMIMGFIRQLQ